MDEQRTQQPDDQSDEHHGTEGPVDAVPGGREASQHSEAGGPAWDRPAVDPELARREHESEDTERAPEHAVEGGV